MTLPIIFVMGVFTIFAIYMTISPFIAKSREQTRFDYLNDEMHELERLVSNRTTLIQSLRELEFEKETGKIGETDYTKFRQRYELQAVGVMRKLDKIHGGRGWEAKIDALITAELGRPSALSRAKNEEE